MKLIKTDILLPFILLFLILLSTIVLRMRLLDVPLERDEGEYAYIGQLILDGTPPYSEAYNMKFPGIYFIYAGILWLFGQTDTAIHLSLLIVNVFSIILLFVFARSMFDDWTGAAAAGAFALLSMSYHVQGFWANAEHFILPLVIGANLLMFTALKKNRGWYFLFSGVLFGCAASVKQQGAIFGIVGFTALLVLFQQKRSKERTYDWKYIFAFLGGIFIPLLLWFFYLAYAGVLKKFYLWTFIYAKEYGSIPTVEDMKFNFIGGFQSLYSFAALIWIVAGVGFIVLFFLRENRSSRMITLGLLVAGIIALSVGFYFRPHYFVFVLPAAALLFGIGIRFLYKVFSPASSRIVRYFPPTLTVIIALAGTLVAHWDVLVQFSLPKVTETVYPLNPFPYSVRIAELLKEKTSKEDRIAIFGNEPQYLFYAQRKSATSFIYFFSLVEEQPLAEQFRLEMMHQVETASPKVLVFNQVQPESSNKSQAWNALENWFFNYARKYYTLTTRFEYLNIHDTVLVTDPVRLSKHPTHVCWISIYEKNK